MSLIQELKRRNVFRVALAYTIVAWLVMQVGDTMGPALHLPEWVPSLLAFLLILGFPIAVFFAWTFELTSEGLQRDSEVGQRTAERAQSDRKLSGFILVLLTLALVYFVVDRFIFTTQPPPANPTDEIAEQAEPEPGDAQGLEQSSIAVLPFVNMSQDTEQEYFSDGLTEELLNLLAGTGELKVAARTSSFYYKDKLDSIPLLEIAKQLEVTHVLEGSVRKSGNIIRITVQLIKAEDGFHLWSETYDRELDDIFALQDEIAAAVMGSLKVTLLGEAPKAKALDPGSFEMALQGRFLFNRRSKGDLRRALELFQSAVELDPSNSVAWVGIVPLYLWLFEPPRISDARTAAETALRLDPGNPEAHMRMAYVLFLEGNNTEGQKSLKQALNLGPDNQLVLSAIAGWMDYLGKADQAIHYQRKAIAADPLHIINLCNMASFLVQANRVDEAEIYISRAMELAPQSTPCIVDIMSLIRLFQGRAEEALELVSTWDSNGGGYADRLLLNAAAYYSMGDLEQSDHYLDIFRREFADQYPLYMANLHAWRDEPDLAFDWLEIAIKQDAAAPGRNLFSNGLSRALLTHPYLLSLHEDPRWQDVIAYWPEEEINEQANLFK